MPDGFASLFKRLKTDTTLLKGFFDNASVLGCLDFNFLAGPSPG